MGCTARVMLHDAADDDTAYETLHLEMLKIGFVRTITGLSRKTYEMPWGTYDYAGSKTDLGVLLAEVTAAAAKTKKKAAVLLTQGAQKWQGLTPA